MNGLTFTHEHFQCILFDDHTYSFVNDNGSLHMHGDKQEGVWEVTADNKEGTKIRLTPNELHAETGCDLQRREGIIIGGLNAPVALEDMIHSVPLPFVGSSIKHTESEGEVKEDTQKEADKSAAAHELELKEKFDGILRGDYSQLTVQ
jgi:hypothetical protein